MGKDTRILLVISVTALVTTALFVVFIKNSTKNESEVVLLDDIPRNITETVSDETEEEDVVEDASRSGVRSAIIGSKEVSKGNYQKIENGMIYYKNGDVVYTAVLNAEDVVLVCTKQELVNADELDYTKITKIKVLSHTELSAKLPLNEMIVVFAEEQEEGGHKAHSIAIDASKCE